VQLFRVRFSEVKCGGESRSKHLWRTAGSLLDGANDGLLPRWMLQHRTRGCRIAHCLLHHDIGFSRL